MVESRQPPIWRSRQFTHVVYGSLCIAWSDLPWILCRIQRFHRW
jgi:hypothetical protein